MFAAFLSTLCGALLNVCVTAMSALGVTLIFKTSVTINFVQSSVAALGCYVTADLFSKYGLPVWAGLIPGVIVGIAFSVFVDAVIFRRGKNVNSLGKQIITMGLVSIIFGGIPLVFGNRESIPFEAFYNTTKAGVSSNVILKAFGGDIVIPKHSLICLAISIVIIGILFVLLRVSRWGLSVRCVASNEFTSELMGINTHVITAVSWGIAGALCVTAAVMYAGGGTMISTSFMTTPQVNALLACILGGFSTFYGPIIGAAIIPLASAAVDFLANIPALSGISRWNMVIIYILMMIAILIKPNGLFGKKIVKKI